MASVARVPVDKTFVLLLGLDLSDEESSEYAFEEAAAIGCSIPRFTMHVVHVAPVDASTAEMARLERFLRIYVSKSAASLCVQPTGGLGLHVCKGEPEREIAQLAEEANADMIVVGTRKRPQSLFVGSTAGRLRAATQRPVFIAAPRPDAEPPAIGIDSPCAECEARREETRGERWWCKRHGQPHSLPKPHLYSYVSDWSFAKREADASRTGSEQGQLPGPQGSDPSLLTAVADSAAKGP